jgi:hypothetical protein
MHAVTVCMAAIDTTAATVVLLLLPLQSLLQLLMLPLQRSTSTAHTALSLSV